MAISLNSVATGVVGLIAVASYTQKQHFKEIDVERINVVESDGRLRLTISNAERSPGWIFKGKLVPGRPKQAGMIFFNDEGEENGGLIFGGQKVDGKISSFGHLSFDQYEQDQDMSLDYNEEAGTRRVGLGFFDRPNIPIVTQIGQYQAVKKMPEGPARDSTLKALQVGYARRAYIGRTGDKTSIVELSDATNHPRLRLSVDSAGAASIEFLDGAGKVTKRLTGSEP